ncbi:MAG: hypothetical protein ACXACY_18155 [Candidatus Hodarchaeales archaeon]|jgi:outer membrane protein assembly factor BamB
MIATKNLLLVSNSIKSYAVDLTTHKTVWSYDIGGLLALSKQGILLIASKDGKVAAINVK